eukprot:CAMPEP_0196658270 /NCGR_PEP_ID=MMETSP1086-20130531/28594_1 /TAXON_ID=77921 /ORGANISM="Cyanoptyche  gloeocystis , Strain SAG4.97" /LENGTH=76 /DNA_ID=CAMNT_0041991761 /DNA_START=138 /DNA_END=368 /DNA_ORIENTATION=-
MQRYSVGDKVDYILMRETPGSPEGLVSRGHVSRVDMERIELPESHRVVESPHYVIVNDYSGIEGNLPAERIIRRVS